MFCRYLMRIVMKNPRKNLFIKTATLLIALILALALFDKASYAYSSAAIDTSRKGSLTVTHYSVDEEFKENVTSHIYLVATIDENGQYTLTDEFKGCFEDPNIFNNGYDYDEWKSSVNYNSASDSDILLDYIVTNDIEEVANGVSDAEGKTYYKDLTLGIYYVLSDKLVEDEFTHTFVNFVYPVPILEKDEASAAFVANYNPSASPKKSKTKNDVLVHCSVLKRWEDAGYENMRPASVTFNIYCDGEFMETVTLSSENNWYYEWQKQGLYTFTVEEVAVAAGYTGKIEIFQDGHDAYYVCTNTYTPPEIPETPSETPETPQTPGIPDLPEVLGAIRDLPAVLGARRLPQTGQLWWPIPILVIVGVILIVRGIKKKNSN